MKENEDYRLIFVDIDGTLLNSHKEIPKSTLYVFEKLNKMGIEVVISSGRQRNNCVKISEISGAGRYIISANGGDIYDRKNNKKINSDVIDINSMKLLGEIIRRYDLRVRMIFENTGYINKDLKNPDEETLLTQSYDEFILTHSIPQIVLYIADFETFNIVKMKYRKSVVSRL